MTGRPSGVDLPQERAYPVYSGSVESVRGWLGAFDVAWHPGKPDRSRCLHTLQRLHQVCPEKAIDWSYQIDLDRCSDHRAMRDCLRRDRRHRFRPQRERAQRAFDLVLDLDDVRRFAMHQPPQGYWQPGPDPDAQADALADMTSRGRRVQKPKFFEYKASICAHSRSQQPGCNQCIDICSTAAIRADGDHIHVEPHLCMGCGACTTVCPSGALAIPYPQRRRSRRAHPDHARHLSHRGRARSVHPVPRCGGQCTDQRDGLAVARGLPARVIPVLLQHMAATGIDVWLARAGVGGEQRRRAGDRCRGAAVRGRARASDGVRRKHRPGTRISGPHFKLLRAADVVGAGNASSGRWRRRSRSACLRHFTGRPTSAPRPSLAIEHLLAHAPVPATEIALPRACSVRNDRRQSRHVHDVPRLRRRLSRKAPSSINAETPQLRFIESKCVQCGICASTCPGDAITLASRLLLTPAAKQPRVLNEAAIFKCIRCDKPLGTEKLIGSMLSRLAGHSMFAEAGALDRLKMCADCRVIDMMKANLESSSAPRGPTPSR